MTWILYPLSFLCGLVWLYAAGFAIPNALAWPRALTPDLVRGITIAISVAAALALLLPHRLLPALIARAQISGRLGLQGLALPVLIFTYGTTRLSGAVADWVVALVMVIFALLFTFPGFVYWAGGAVQPRAAPPVQTLSSAEFHRIIAEKAEQYPLPLRLLVVLPLVLPAVSVLAIFNNWHVIPSGWIALNAVPLGWAMGLVATLVPACLLYSWIPHEKWRSSRFNLILIAFVSFTAIVAGYISFLRTVIPTLVASYSGAPGERVVIVESVARQTSKGCRRGAKIVTALIVLDLCEVGDDLIASLRPGDRLLLKGKATSLGFAVEDYARIP